MTIAHWVNICQFIRHGHVGIGTTSPDQKLSVSGAIESTTGGFKFPDGTTMTTAAKLVGSGGGAAAAPTSGCPTGYILIPGGLQGSGTGANPPKPLELIGIRWRVNAEFADV